MSELKLNIVLDGLNKIKKSFENIKIGSKEKAKTKQPAGALAIGGAVSLLSELVKKTTAIQTILDAVAAMLNSLIAPLVPLLLGLFKPVFVLLRKFLDKALSTFFKDDSTFFDVTSTINSIIGAIVAGIAVLFAGGGIITAVMAAIAAAIALSSAFDLGAWISDNIVDPLAETLVNWIDDLSSWLATNIDSLSNTLAGWINDLSSWLATNINSISDTLSGWIDDISTTLADLITNLANTFSNWIDSLATKLSNIITDLINTIKEKLGFGRKERYDRASGFIGPITKFIHLGKFIGSIHMQQWKWQRCGIKSLARQMQHHTGILTNRVKHDRIAKLGHHFPHDVNGLRFQRFELSESVFAHLFLLTRMVKSPHPTLLHPHSVN